MKYLFLIPILGSFFYGCSSASYRSVSFDPDEKKTADSIVYSFSVPSEREVFIRTMRPPGSSIVRAEIYRNSICVASWSKKDGEQVFAIWTLDAKPVYTSLKTTGNITGFYAMDGSRVRLQLSRNKIYADLSGRILYIVGAPGLSVEIPEK